LTDQYVDFDAIRVDHPAFDAEIDADMRAADEHFAATLRQLRKARRLTQEQLAEAMGISQSEISRIEQEANLLLSTLRRFVAATGGRLESRAVCDDHAVSLEIGDLTGEMPPTGIRTAAAQPSA